VKKEYTIAVSVLGNAVDDPDVVLYQNHVCGTSRNYTGHCNPALDQEIDRQSMEPDIDRRRRMVWEIDRTLQQELARPILYHRRAATCWNPRVKGLTLMVNSSYSGWRMEDVWLAR
jgi:peptide/nickel transport system substrate-binding protein